MKTDIPPTHLTPDRKRPSVMPHKLSAIDYELGERVHQHLIERDCETPCAFPEATMTSADEHFASQVKVAEHIRGIMQELGLRVDSDEFEDTPAVATNVMFRELFMGLDYGHFPKCNLIEREGVSAMSQRQTTKRRLAFHSTCEKSLLPFSGEVSVGFIHSSHTISDDALNALVAFFSRRPQSRERFALQLREVLSFILGTDDVVVLVVSSSTLGAIRGNASTSVTSEASGHFETEDGMATFLQLQNFDNADRL